MAILSNSRPSTGWRRGDLTNNCIKEIFDVGETHVFQNCNDKNCDDNTLELNSPEHCHNP